MCKNYNVPVFWLRVTDFMHGWLESELGGNARIGEQRVVSLDSLPGAKEALKMETTEDVNQPRTVGLAMSAAKYNCVMTYLSRRSTNVIAPRFLTRCTHPARVTSLPASEIRSSPQLLVLYIVLF